jgi:hypothetical protein
METDCDGDKNSSRVINISKKRRTFVIKKYRTQFECIEIILW